MQVYLVWGSPRETERRTVIRCTCAPTEVRMSGDRRFAIVEVGPVSVSGPVLHWAGTLSVPPTPAEVVIYGGVDIPDWATGTFPADWGWSTIIDLPSPLRYPLQVDALLLARNWAGTLDGWSKPVWLDHPAWPMQRLSLRIGDWTPEHLSVRVLDTGATIDGLPYVVFDCPDRQTLDGVGVTRHGWRKEPAVRFHHGPWNDLSVLAERMEAMVTPVLGGSVVRDVVLHMDLDDQAIETATLLLPHQVKDALAEAMERRISNEERS